MPPHSPIASVGPIALEVACAYLADAVVGQAASGNPAATSRDLEEAARQLARAANRAGLEQDAVVRRMRHGQRGPVMP